MEEPRKRTYEPPVTEVVIVKTEGIICLSGEFNGFGDEESW